MTIPMPAASQAASYVPVPSREKADDADRRPPVGQSIGLMVLCIGACLAAGQLRKHASQWAYSVQPSFHGAEHWSWAKAYTGGLGIWLLVVLLATLIASTYVDDTPTRLGIGFFAGSFAFGNVIWLILFSIGHGALPHLMWSWPTWLLGWGLDAFFLASSAMFAAYVAGRALVGLIVASLSVLVLWLTYFLGDHGHLSFVLRGVTTFGFLWPHLIIVIMIGIGACVMLNNAPPLPPPFTITGGYATVHYSSAPYQPPGTRPEPTPAQPYPGQTYQPYQPVAPYQQAPPSAYS